MPRKQSTEPYYERLARLMVRDDKNCWQAATELELGLTTAECDELHRHPEFQRCLRTERNKYYAELATDPQRTKNTLIGQAVVAIEKLMAAEQYEKGLNGILTLAKIEGWVGSDTNISVFAGLSSREISDLKAKLKAKAEPLTLDSADA